MLVSRKTVITQIYGRFNDLFPLRYTKSPLRFKKALFRLYEGFSEKIFVITNYFMLLLFMDNKITVEFTAPFSYDESGQSAFNASSLDELLTFCEDAEIIDTAAGDGSIIEKLQVSTRFVPESLTDDASVTFFQNSIQRQDVKRRVADRLPRVTFGQGLVILSASDQYKKYFINSIVYKTASGFLRVGIANFTADQATNPFASGNNATLNAVWGFFDLTAEMEGM